jgi:putative colanic acid biosynthesis UDP-glucose lipid carrier transferase
MPLSSALIATFFILLDSVAILGAGLAAYAGLVHRAGAPVQLYAAAVCFVWIVALLLFHFASLYRFDVAMRPLRAADALLVAMGAVFLFLIAAAYSIKPSEELSRLWVVFFAAGSFAGVLALRLLGAWAVSRLVASRVAARSLAIVGGGERAGRLISLLESRRLRLVRIAGVYAPDANGELADDSGAPFAGNFDKLLEDIRMNRIDDVVLALPWSQDARIAALVEHLREFPVNVYLLTDLLGFRFNFRPPPSHFGELPLVAVMGKPLSGWDRILKGLEDYLLGSFLALFFLVPMLVIALAIRLDGPGPVFFSQLRLGFNNRPFRIYKFRTMHAEPGPAPRTIQATRDDPRATRVGRFLRRWSLDELPQLLNGTMSLVGPRPHAIDHNEEYAQKIRGYFARHRVKPGITGLAQVRGFRGPTDTVEKMDARVKSDIFYTENWSLTFDLRILAMTAVICITGRNAY